MSYFHVLPMLLRAVGASTRVHAVVLDMVRVVSLSRCVDANAQVESVTRLFWRSRFERVMAASELVIPSGKGKSLDGKEGRCFFVLRD